MAVCGAFRIPNREFYVFSFDFGFCEDCFPDQRAFRALADLCDASCNHSSAEARPHL